MPRRPSASTTRASSTGTSGASSASRRASTAGASSPPSEHANIAQAAQPPARHHRRMNEPARTDGHAHAPATIKLGDLEVQRMGYGAMRLPGKDVWGDPDDPARARRVLKRAVELGINFIDTAWYYGPLVANRLIAEALHPYPKDLVIATKLGGKRLPDKGWAGALRPDELRKGAEEDLRTLRRERLDVVHLRYAAGAGVPFMESLDAILAMQAEGMIRHVALSNV